MPNSSPARPWYETSFRRLLVDMHIPDWDPAFMRDFDPERFAELMELAGTGVAEIAAGSCLGLCYWPTDIGVRHGVLDGRDLLGETVEACRKRGIGVVLYLNVWCRAVYDLHPEWRLIPQEGAGFGRFGICCPNTGYGEFFLALADELNSRYDCLGIWVDMIGWFRFICHCPACRERFRRDTGRGDIPGRVDWNDPAWLAFQECRARWLEEFALRVRECVKARTPGRSLALQGSSFAAGWFGATSLDFMRTGDYLAGDFTGDRFEQSCICKLFRVLARRRPVEFMAPRCETLDYHTTDRNPEHLTMQAYAAIANQACFTLIDAIDPAGTLNRNFYVQAAGINRIVREYEPYLSASSRPLTEAAVYVNGFVRAGAEIAPPAYRGDYNFQLESWMKLVRCFAAGHRQLGFATPEAIGETPVLLLDDRAVLSEEECARIREYVAGGGRLYASGRTSLYDPAAGRLEDFRLADLFGVHHAGDELPAGHYIDAGEGAPLQLSGPIQRLRETVEAGTEILGRLVLAWSDRGAMERFGSAISDPPKERTDFPALVRRKYGRGEVIYCAGTPETETYWRNREFAGRLLASLLPPATVETDLPGYVEITVFDQPEDRRLVVSLLNLPMELPSPEFRDCRVRLRLPAGLRAERLTLAPGGGAPARWQCRDGTVEFTLDRLHRFAMVLIGYG